MLNSKNSYVGLTQQPQRRTYPTAGLLNSGPAVSPVTQPTPKGATDPGSLVRDPPTPTAPTQPVFTPPPVGPAAPTVPAIDDPMQQAFQQPAQQPPRDKLVEAMMGGGRGGSEV